MAHLKHTMFVSTSVDALDAFVRDPHRWSEFIVGMSGPTRVFGDGGQGTKAEFAISMLGVQRRVVYRTVEERHNPDGSTEWRWELEGATWGWMTCHHEPRDKGVDVTTEFDYGLPGSVFGKVADRLLFEKRMRRDFEEGLENLKLVAETTVPAATVAPIAATA
jgi:hypothetical protein